MLNNTASRQQMQLLNIKVRKNSFLEVTLGYTPDQAMDEASRCLNCKDKPCVSGCSMNVHIPAFVTEVARGNFEKAYDIISKASKMPAICSRVCSSNPKCEAKCRRTSGAEPVAIAALERFVADFHNFNEQTSKESQEIASNGHKIAVIGSGPAGLACAGELAEKGYEVSVFEERATVGGQLDSAIPKFRLPKAIMLREIEKLRNHGVEITLKSSVGHLDEAEKLISAEGYDAVYLSERNEIPARLGIRGEDLKGVLSADSFMTWLSGKEINKFYVEAPYVNGCKAVVFGRTMEVLDTARCLRRFGADVTVICPEASFAAEASADEILRAEEEDIKFLYLTNITELAGNKEKHVTGVYCEQLMMTVIPGSNRTNLIPLYDSEFHMAADIVIISREPVSGNAEDPNLDSAVFRFSGESSVIDAMGAGKNDAALIDSFVRSRVRA